jgi:hypothetical protein
MHKRIAQFPILAISAVLVFSATAQQELTIDQVMSPDELRSTGVSALTQGQRKELDRWLTRYTNVLLAGKRKTGGCDPAIETRIDGDFEGWEDETTYKLRNGQIWQQARYHYHYHYAYAPEVTIYSTAEGCAMKVSDDDDEPIPVRRLK